MSSGEASRPWRNRIVGHGEEAPESLLANPLNFRIHPKPQQDALSGGLNALGWIAEVLVNRRSQTVIDGHLRVELAISRGEPMVPVTYVDLSPEEERLALLTLDPISAMAAQDAEKLEALLAEVETQEPGLQAMLDELGRNAGIGLGGALEEDEAPVDQAAELMAKWGTARGQLWEVGRHRILCGDAYGEDLLGGETPSLLLADPPYGIDIVKITGGRLGSIDGPKAFGSVAGGAKRYGTVDAAKIAPVGHYTPVEGDDRPFDPTPFLGLAKTTVLWGANYYADKLPPSSGWLVWDKREEDMGHNTFAECEMAWTSDGQPARIFRHLWMGLMKASERGEKRSHPTQKPVALMAWVIDQFSQVGELVYDPFLGSGSTLMACHQRERRGYGIEIEPKYVAVSLERLSLLGLTPKLLTAATS